MIYPKKKKNSIGTHMLWNYSFELFSLNWNYCPTWTFLELDQNLDYLAGLNGTIEKLGLKSIKNFGIWHYYFMVEIYGNIKL